MCRLFSCIPIFRGGGGVKIALLLVKNVFINVGEGMSKLWCWVAAKHTIDADI